MGVGGFDWDEGNTAKCRKHGVSRTEIEALFTSGRVFVGPDVAHSSDEERFQAIGRAEGGRFVFVVFTFRLRDGIRHLRPIGARYMHRKEVARFEEDNPDLRD